MGVNNLPTVVTQECPIWDRTRDLLIARPMPYRCATTPPLETHNALESSASEVTTLWRYTNLFIIIIIIIF